MKYTFTFITLMFLALLTVNGQNEFHLFDKSRQTEVFDKEQLYLPFEEIRQVEINTLFLEDNAKYLKKGDKVTLNLFEKQQVTSTIDRINLNVNGTLSIRSRLDDYPMGYLIMSVTDGLVTASIRIPELNQRYSLKSHKSSGSSFLKKLDVSRMDILESGPDMIREFLPEMTPAQIQRLEEAAQRDDNEIALVGVMVIYTPAAANWANTNESSIENSIAQAMEKAQLTLDNSNTLMEMELVYSSQVSYTESGSSHTDLYALTDGTGVFAEVHDWRETYGADLVGFFTLVTDTGGLGWLLNNKFGLPGTGFSITRVQQASWTYTHIHEMGHNMGAHHHKLQNVQPGPTIWHNWPENVWSAGWRWQGTNNQMYCDIMTYNNGIYFADGIDATKVPYFSNPDISVMGFATGHAIDGDNARTVREVRHVIAAYTEASLPEIPRVTFSVKDIHQQPIFNAKISILPQGKYLGTKTFGADTFSVSENINNYSHPQLAVQHRDVDQIRGTAKKQSKSGAWLHWDNDENASSVGLNDGGIFYTGAWWTPAEIAAYQGYAISQMRIFVNNLPTSITLKIWQGPDEDSLTEVYSQSVSSLEEESWHLIDLTNPYPVNVTQELWLGYEVDDPGAGVFAAGIDDSEEHDGKGNKVLLSDAAGWEDISIYGITGNWNLQAYLELNEPIVLYTNANGMAVFDASPGNYTYQVEKPGYELHSGSFAVSQDDISEEVILLAGGNAPLVTFNVNIQGASPAFVPGESNVFLTGSFTNWAVPGSINSVVLTFAGSYIYTATVPMAMGEHEYKYFSDAFGEGWDGGEWQGDPYRVITVTGDMEVNDVWTGPHHELKLQANPVHAGNLGGGGFYYPNTEVTLTAAANPGFVFLHWTGEGNEVLSTEPVFNYVTACYGQTLTAHFEEDANQYQLSTEVSPAATGTIAGSGSYLVGSEVELSATPVDGYEFLYWRHAETIIGFEKDLSFAMPSEDVHLIAYFKLMTVVAEYNLPEVKVFPNPTRTLLNIESEIPVTLIEITDIHGRVIMKNATDDENISVDVSGWNQGLYILRVHTPNGVIVKRFLVH